MEKKLTKHGNSVALIIDKALLKLLKIDESSIVTLSIEDGVLLIPPTKKKYKATTKKNNNETADDSLSDEIIEKHKAISFK